MEGGGIKGGVTGEKKEKTKELGHGAWWDLMHGDGGWGYIES